MSDTVAPPRPTKGMTVLTSPSRLNDFLGCEHRTYLDILERRGELARPRDTHPDAQLIMERGQRHEAAFLQTLRDEGRDVVAIPTDGPHTERAALTREAMRDGREVIHQACFRDGDRVGFPDFLIRLDTPSGLGSFSYEVHDAKLSTHPRPDYVFQLLFYTEQLEQLQGLRPRRMHLILGSGERPPFAPEEFEAYAAQVVAHFEQRRGELAAGAEPAYPYPVADCEFCPWWKHCRDRRRADDHLCLVAGLNRDQGLKLEAVGVPTVTAVAGLEPTVKVDRLARQTLAGLRQQAALQVASRGLDRPEYELLEPVAARGFGRLPVPSPGDVFFDFEGDQFWGDAGLQYLFGTWTADEGYWALWAHGEAEEKANLETWIDWITARLHTDPALHVYHYNHYEPTTLKQLAQRHATREHELDELLRREVFVDLYAVVRQSMRIGTESYSLKAIEPAFGFERVGELRSGMGSLRHWQAYNEGGDDAELEAIRVYNANDCRSTLELRDWLGERRREAEAAFDVDIGALQPLPTYVPPEATQMRRARVAELREALGDEPDHQLLGELLAYHEREAKPAWWAYFARREMTVEQLRDEDSEAIGDLRLADDLTPYPDKQSIVTPLRFPAQPFKLGPGSYEDPITGGKSNVVRVDDEGVVWIKRGKASLDKPWPRTLIPGGAYGTAAQQDALLELAQGVVTGGLGETAAADMLLRRPPRLVSGTPPLAGGSVDLGVLRRQVRGLDRTALVIQGPPGTGKTYTGARLATDLIRAGKRVGVIATSHKAITNLLAELDDTADNEGLDFRGRQKPGDDLECAHTGSDRIELVTDNQAYPPAEEEDVQLVAGTAWLWASERMRDSVDVLFVDEAGQMSLADALAVSLAANSVVLLGDPQQLAHVSQGTHPDGAGASVLEHLLAGADTIAADRGVFLETTWRMSPDVCAFVSDTMYDGKLEPLAGTRLQRVASPGLAGAGLRMLAVEHDGCRQSSPDEATAIALEVSRLLDGGSYTDRDGVTRALTLEHILVVAPYNAQVRCLRAALPDGARVGTVDKFQGQEAPVVFFSMTSSSGDDVPRGMDFLFSRNRLNVAVSRAQAMAVVVCSPRLLRTRCASVEQMRLVNMLCRFAERAGLE